MNRVALSSDQVAALLKPKTPQVPDIEPTAFNFKLGPLRHYDRTMRCASRGCSSSTNFKLNGIPYCMMHSLRTMNELLAEGTDET